MHIPVSALASAAAIALFAPIATAQTQPRYFTQMQAELQAMGLAPQCASASTTAGTCTVRATAAAAQPGATAPARARRFVLSLQYDDNSDTIYVYADHYASLRADAPHAAQAFRRLLELNWEMLVGRFEWSPSSGEVRLSAVINTDSNFDRRAFRGVVRSLLRLADRYAEEVARLTGSPVGETAEAPAPAPGTNAPTATPATTGPRR